MTEMGKVRQHRGTGGFDGARRRPGTHRRFAPGGLVSLLFAVALLLFGGLAVVLTRGPVDLSGAMPRLEAMANAALGDAAGGLRVSVGAAWLSMGSAESPAPGVYLHDVRLIDGDGTVRVAAPRVRVGFRPLDLVAGRLRLSSITVLGAQLALRRGNGRGLVGDLAPLAPEEQGETAVLPLLAALAAEPPPLLEALNSIAFERLALTVEGGDPTAAFSLHDVAARLWLRDGAVSATARVLLASPGSYVTLVGGLSQTGGLRVEVSVPEVPMAHWAGLVPALADYDLPVAAEIGLSLDADGALVDASASLAAGRGGLALAGRTVPVESAQLNVRWVDDGLDIEAFAIEGVGAALSGSGRVELVREADAVIGATAALSLGPVTLPLDPGVAAGPVARLGGGMVAARVLTDPWRVEIADAYLARGDLRVGLSGRIEEAGAGWSLALGGHVRGLAVPDLLSLWPRPVAPGALSWMRTHLEAGLVDEAVFNIGGTLDAPQAMLDFAFRDTRASPLPPLPPITGGRGVGRVDGDSLVLTLDAGAVTVPGPAGGTIDLAGSTFRLAPIAGEDAPGRIALRGAGPIGAVLSLIGAPPLSLLDRVAIDPADVTGMAQVAADLVVPLRRDLLLEEVSVAVDAELADAAMTLDAPLGRFAAPRLSLRADTASLRLEGEGLVGASPVAVRWDEVFEPPPDTPRSTLALSLTLDPADAAALGLRGEAVAPQASLALRGAVPVDLRVWQGGAGMAADATAFEADMDLRRIAFDAPVLGVSKPDGAAGRAQVAGVASGAGVALDRVTLSSADLRFAGRARLDRTYRLARLDINALAIGDGTDTAGSVVRRDGSLDVTLEGRSLDVSGLADLLDAESGGAGTRGEAIAVTFDLDRLVLSPRLALTEARGKARRRRDGAVAVALEAIGPRNAPLSLTVEQQVGEAGQLSLTSRNGGALAREAGLFSRALGGTLDLSATLQPDGAVDGEARVTDVIVSEDPRLDRLLRGAELEAALAQLRADGIRFDTVRAPFRWAADTLTLREAVAYGPVIGLTLTGTYAVERDTLAMSGVFTPLHGINSLIGNLPLIGTLLTGGEGQGVLAFTFDLTGPAADPEISINPFSVLLPGALRRILQPGPDGEPPVEEHQFNIDRR